MRHHALRIAVIASCAMAGSTAAEASCESGRDALAMRGLRQRAVIERCIDARARLLRAASQSLSVTGRPAPSTSPSALTSTVTSAKTATTPQAVPGPSKSPAPPATPAAPVKAASSTSADD